MAWDSPLAEFATDASALIDPQPVPVFGEVPEHAVMCFFRDVIDEVCGQGRAEVVATCSWEHGSHQLYSLPVGDRRVGVFHPGIGAPLACGRFEEMIATGCRKFVAAGRAPSSPARPADTSSSPPPQYATRDLPPLPAARLGGRRPAGCHRRPARGTR